MGRPIKKKFIGDQKNNPQTHYIVCTAWPVGASSAVACTIKKQKSSNRYKVSDGTHISVCKLVTGTPTAAGQMSITVQPYVAPTVAAIFTVNMTASHATLVGGGAGTNAGYHVSDVLTVVGGTFTTAATITVNTVDGGGGILTFTLTTGGSYSVLPANPVATTDLPANGTGATFTLTYGVLNFSDTGHTGTGYGTNTEIQFIGGGYTSQATGTVVSTTGSLLTPTIVSAGAGYTSIPTVNALSFGATDYASKVNNRTVETFGDKKYKWELDTQALVGAGNAAGNTSQGTQTLGYALIQSN